MWRTGAGELIHTVMIMDYSATGPFCLLTSGTAKLAVMHEPRPCYFGQWVLSTDDQHPPSQAHDQLSLLPDLLRADVSLKRSTERDLADAQEWVGRLDAVVARLPHRKELGEMALRLDARSSAELDNTVASAREALAAGLRGSLTPETNEELKRYQQIGFDGAAAMLAGRPWNLALLGRLSSAVTAPAGDGEIPWRKGTARLSAPNPRDAYPLGPPAESKMRALTGEWCRWMNKEQDWSVVGKATLGMLQFMALSPIAGSMAVARLVPAFELMRAGRLSLPVLPLSTWLWQQADEVSRIVSGVFDRGDIDTWMSFVASGIRTTCVRQVELISSLNKVCDTMLRRVWRKTAIIKLVEALIARPVINVIHIAEICDVSPKTATVLVKRLQETGLAKTLHSKTLESKADDNSHGKVIVATGIVRLLGLLQSHPSDRDLDAHT